MDRRQFLEASAMATVWASTTSLVSIARSDEKAGDQASSAGMHLRYAINIGTHFTNHPVLDRLQKVADFGFTAVENNGLPDLDRVAGSNEPNYDAIALYGQKLKELGMTQATWVTNGCAGKCNCSITDDSGTAEFLRRVHHTTKISPLVAGTISTVTSGIEVPKLSSKEMTQNVITALKKAAEIVEKAGGPVLVLEPLNVLVDHPGYHVVKTDHAAEIIDAVGSPKVKILYDIYHQQISEGNLIGNIRKHYDRIGYFQFGDHPGRHEPFTGEIHYPNVFKAIYQLGYQGMVGGEYGPAGGGNDDASIASMKAVRLADQW
ncbi:TIM barrel protein [bacterium]|nr:TIM barrel protein [bacterium]